MGVVLKTLDDAVDYVTSLSTFPFTLCEAAAVLEKVDDIGDFCGCVNAGLGQIGIGVNYKEQPKYIYQRDD